MPSAGVGCQARVRVRLILTSFALDASHAWLAAAALVSGVLAYVGAMVGLVLGQFRLPLLVAALGSAPAVASNLAISSLGAATGALGHAREGRVDVRLLLSIGVPSAAAAYVASRMLAHVEAWWIEAVIGGTLLISAIPTARKAWSVWREAKAEPSAKAAGPADDELRPPTTGALLVEIAIGAVLGAVSGVVGLLLGTLRLPAMLRLGVSPPKAAGTNMAIGFFTGVSGALGAVGSGRVSLLAFVMVGSTTLLGAWLGAKRTKRLPRVGHFALIGGVLMVVGVWMMTKAFLVR